MKEKNKPLSRKGSNRRVYLRLDTVFPVRFKLLSLTEARAVSDWLQGFTNNIGTGGVCITAQGLSEDSALLMRSRQVKLELELDIPTSRSPVTARAQVVWLRETLDREPSGITRRRYLIGTSYEAIDRAQNSRIMRYAWTKRLFFPFFIFLAALLLIAVIGNGYYAGKLAKGNRVLVYELARILQDTGSAKQKIQQINQERQDLQIKIQALESRLDSLQAERQAENEQLNKIEELNAQIERASREKGLLQEHLIALQQRESAVAEELLRLDKRRASLHKTNIDKMYQWISVHQNPRTGLVVSFEGDSAIAEWAFTYDQSLAAQAYVYFGDYERAKKIFAFYEKKAGKTDGLFLNAYYTSDGSPAEYAVRSGPNIWLGIAIMHYTRRTQDTRYLHIAEEIARVILALQAQDADGGLRGGPDVSWYATEHNLDAYAFLGMMHKITKRKIYQDAQDRILAWLLQHTYDMPQVPIKRGKGDATIATDTYAWSIAAIGPEKLNSLGMNPDKIMEFVEGCCAAEILFQRPEGAAVRVKGFDFAPRQHLPQGGVVSCEWTAQMVLAYKIMAAYYSQQSIAVKARLYDSKADDYLTSLASMIISSPSASGQGTSCLPYASKAEVDTGHGWTTPKGKSTGSLAGTVYTVFAYYKYNPLELK